MLKDILHMISISYPQIHYPLTIMYRVTVKVDGVEEDTLAGYCEYNGNELVSLDGDSYSLDDELIAYSIFKTDTNEFLLSVTYEGEFVWG